MDRRSSRAVDFIGLVFLMESLIVFSAYRGDMLGLSLGILLLLTGAGVLKRFTNAYRVAVIYQIVNIIVSFNDIPDLLTVVNIGKSMVFLMVLYGNAGEFSNIIVAGEKAEKRYNQLMAFALSITLLSAGLLLMQSMQAHDDIPRKDLWREYETRQGAGIRNQTTAAIASDGIYRLEPKPDRIMFFSAGTFKAEFRNEGPGELTVGQIRVVEDGVVKCSLDYRGVIEADESLRFSTECIPGVPGGEYDIVVELDYETKESGKNTVKTQKTPVKGVYI
ncbi:MAG: hypothetical protein GF416_02530 [Candidatus Altiarchaeales archaeon]|nr:hypothetical protein [Candidatus Altiarchaeales archaeon]MBD3415995.1 hypothetical protein [Candidatus Altiarchaeales archaeon]